MTVTDITTRFESVGVEPPRILDIVARIARVDGATPDSSAIPDPAQLYIAAADRLPRLFELSTLIRAEISALEALIESLVDTMTEQDWDIIFLRTGPDGPVAGTSADDGPVGGAAVTAVGVDGPEIPAGSLSRADAILRVLEHNVGNVLAPQDITVLLHSYGRDDDTNALVSGALQRLVRNGLVVRTGRAQYHLA
jgi:hypothetical protein